MRVALTMVGLVATVGGLGCSSPVPAPDADRDVTSEVDAHDATLDGCDADLSSDPLHCGACSNACPVAPRSIALCIGGTCTSQCAPGSHRCGTTCESDDDIRHCGPTCQICIAPAGATPVCTNSGCSFVCPGGLHPCGSACVDGSNVSTCGTRCDPCDPPANATPTCDGTACGFVCGSGFHACGDQCASDRSTATCGSGCVACVAPAHATSVCSTGVCGFVCEAGFGDCDGSSSNGCETDLESAANCGACGAACGTSEVCAVDASGAHCATACPATASLACGSGCVDPMSDPAHCGDCATQCLAPDNAVAVCRAGTCGFTCANGFGDCDSDPSNGCETDLDQDVSHCGACGVSCPLGERCVAGACTCTGGVHLSTDIQPIFDATCTSDTCHGGPELSEMLSLEAGSSYRDLVGVTSTTCTPALRVVAGDPAASYLLNKLTGSGLCNGQRMPLDLPALPYDQIELVARWICEGAPND